MFVGEEGFGAEEWVFICGGDEEGMSARCSRCGKKIWASPYETTLRRFLGFGFPIMRERRWRHEMGHS